MNILLMGPIIIMVGLSFFMKRYFNSWIAPGVFFPTLWTFFVIVPILFAPSYPIFSFGLWVIIFFMVAVGVGAITADHFNYNINGYQSDSELNDIFSIFFIMSSIFTIISMIGLILLLFFGISRFSLTNSLLDFLILPNQFSMDRYHGAVVIPPSIRIMMYLLYPASLIGGVSMHQIQNNRLKKLLMIMPVILSIGYAFILTTRSTILLSIILWASGWFASRFFNNDNNNTVFKIKSMFMVLLSFSIFTGIFVVTAWLRDSGGEFFVDAILENISAYFFGYLSSFTQWIQMYDKKDLFFGLVTFAGPADLLGLTERQLGFYNEISVLGTSHSNIFTALRGVIHDFSILGGFLFFGLFGFVATVALNECKNKRIFWIIPLSAFYAFTIYSPLISIFNYNSILFSWVILGGTILVTPIIKKIL